MADKARPIFRQCARLGRPFTKIFKELAQPRATSAKGLFSPRPHISIEARTFLSNN